MKHAVETYITHIRLKWQLEQNNTIYKKNIPVFFYYSIFGGIGRGDFFLKDHSSKSFHTSFFNENIIFGLKFYAMSSSIFIPKTWECHGF